MIRWSQACVVGAILLGCGPATSGAGEHEEHEEGEHGEGHASEVTLSEAAITRAGIEVGAVRRAPIGGGTGVPAEVQADPAATAHVSSLVAGRVNRVDVSIGDRVEAGQVLAVVSSTEVGETRAALSGARIRRDAARAARDRQAALVESGIGARRALVEAEAELAAAEAEMAGLGGSLRVMGRSSAGGVEVTATVAGVVIARHATAGEVVDAGELLFTVTEPGRVWVVGHVPELDLAVAREGALATLSVGAFPGDRWPGHIDFVSPALDERTRTLDVRFVLDEPDPRLRAGLFGRVSIAGEGAEPNALVVPADALARVGGEDVVFVPADEERTYRPVPIRLGRRDGDVVEIVEGLDEGQAVVVSGAFTLRSELSRGELAEHED